MSDTLNPSIDRRSLLRTASSALGAAVLSSSGVSRLLPKAAAVSVAFIEGDRLVPAAQVKGAPVPFERAQLTISSVGKGSLRSLKANYDVATRNSIRRFPFLAWVYGGARTRFEMPVGLKSGLNFSVTQRTQMGEETSDLQLGPAGQVKLNEGTYIVAAGNVDWSSYRVVSGGLASSTGGPTTLQHLLVTVERA